MHTEPFFSSFAPVIQFTMEMFSCKESLHSKCSLELYGFGMMFRGTHIIYNAYTKMMLSWQTRRRSAVTTLIY